MENSVRQRIIETFEKFNTNPTQFSGEDSAMQKRLSRQLKGGASVTCETLLSILNKYDVSAEWLLRGKGEMLNQPSEIVSGDNITLDISMDSKDVVIKALTEKIQRLESDIADLRRKYEPSEERPGA